MNYKELMEEFKEMVSKYCYAISDVLIKKDEEGEWYLDGGLHEGMYTVGGLWDEKTVAEDIMQGDFPFDGVDKEGLWHFEFFLQYNAGGYDHPSYFETLVVEKSFVQSIDEYEKNKEYLLSDSTETDLFGNKINQDANEKSHPGMDF